MSATRLTIRLDAKLRKRLAAAAKHRGRPVSEIVREVLDAHCPAPEKPMSCYDLAMKLGIIGMAKDTPPDLSTNRKYFQGFGE